MELDSLTFDDFVDLVDVMWLDNLMSLPQEALNSGIWNVLDISKNTGDSRRMSEINREEYAESKTEGNQAERLRIQQGYTKDLEAYPRIAKDVGITYEMRTRNKAPEVVAALQDMVALPWNTIERDLQALVSNFSATSYTAKDGRTVDISTGDSLAWGATAHLVKGSSVTYRNILANNPRVSRGSIEAMERLAIENTINQFGEKIAGARMDILFTTDDPSDCNIIMEYLESIGSPDFDNPQVKNVYKGKYRHVKLSRVAIDVATGQVDTDKRHYWGMASSRYTTSYIGFWERPHTIAMYETKDGTDNWQTGVRAGYGICSVSGRGVFFSKGDGTA